MRHKQCWKHAGLPVEQFASEPCRWIRYLSTLYTRLLLSCGVAVPHGRLLCRAELISRTNKGIARTEESC